MNWAGAVFVAAALIVACRGEKLAILMLDGFRWDYADRMTEAELPNLKAFLSGGARAEYVQPIFPSMSWACWTTVATGLSAERHGILSNYMYNRTTGLTFGLDVEDSHDPSWWDQHVPLWTTATEAGAERNKH